VCPSHTYVVRPATGADGHALRTLAELDSRPRLAGPALVGGSGQSLAAISFHDGRVSPVPSSRPRR
jgi:hypothetical protein